MHYGVLTVDNICYFKVKKMFYYNRIIFFFYFKTKTVNIVHNKRKKILITSIDTVNKTTKYCQNSSYIIHATTCFILVFYCIVSSDSRQNTWPLETNLIQASYYN